MHFRPSTSLHGCHCWVGGWVGGSRGGGTLKKGKGNWKLVWGKKVKHTWVVVLPLPPPPPFEAGSGVGWSAARREQCTLGPVSPKSKMADVSGKWSWIAANFDEFLHANDKTCYNEDTARLLTHYICRKCRNCEMTTQDYGMEGTKEPILLQCRLLWLLQNHTIYLIFREISSTCSISD